MAGNASNRLRRRMEADDEERHEQTLEIAARLGRALPAAPGAAAGCGSAEVDAHLRALLDEVRAVRPIVARDLAVMVSLATAIAAQSARTQVSAPAPLPSDPHR